MTRRSLRRTLTDATRFFLLFSFPSPSSFSSFSSSISACSMLPRDSGGVVDTNLVVYGTKNVRVVDASIMPLQVSAHLMAPAYGVAEKAADIVRPHFPSIASDGLLSRADSLPFVLPLLFLQIKKAYELVVVESSSMAASTATSASSNPSASAAVGAGAGAGSSNAAASTTSLSAGAKGGIIGGVVGGVAIAAIIVSRLVLSSDLFDASNSMLTLLPFVSFNAGSHRFLPTTQSQGCRCQREVWVVRRSCSERRGRGLGHWARCVLLLLPLLPFSPPRLLD